MALMKWSDEFSVGVAAFDEEHKRLMAMVNELYDGMMSGTAAARLDEIIAGLIAYTVEHFRHEESVFERHGYPGRREHHEQHERLKQTVAEFRARASQSKGSHIAIDLSKFLKDWLLQHIRKEDKLYGTYLNAKGVV